MDKLLKILNQMKPEVDFTQEKNLIDNEILDSFDIVSLVAALEDEFDVEITAANILPENFNSAEAILNMIEKLENE